MASEPQLPDANAWQSNSTLKKVRTHQLELKIGAKDAGPNDAVRMMQQTLVYWGRKVHLLPLELLPNFGADGHFGAESKDALIRYQSANKDANGQPLAADGILGDLTLGAMDKLVSTPNKPPPPPPPPPDDDGKLIEIFVDIVYFSDGPEKWRMNEMFPIANKVFKRMNIKVSLGDKILPGGKGTKPLDSDDFANKAFEINRKDGKIIPGATRSELSTLTAQGSIRTLELNRLTLFNRKDRVTAFFIAPFPEGVQGKVGVTFNPAAHKTSPTIFVSKSYVAVDCFWHELGHALLNTSLDVEDHEFETFMYTPVGEERRTATITDKQRAAIRATAKALSLGK